MTDEARGIEEYGKVYGAGNIVIWGDKRYYTSSAVVIPKIIAKRLGIKTGDRVRFKEDCANNCIIIKKVSE